MSKAEEALQYSRALECNNLTYLGGTDVDSFLKAAKEDWNLRAIKDASQYICASPRASEEQIRASGGGDTAREFVIRCGLRSGSVVDTILEIGCGFGRMSMFLSRWCTQHLYAVDISKELLLQARQRIPLLYYPHVEFLETDGMHLDGIPDDSVDIAFEYIVFQHISSTEVITSYIREVDKKLKVGGRFIMHGRDVSADTGGATLGNTWHGCQCGGDLVRKSIAGTTLRIEKEESVGTDRYWATLVKDLVRGA